MDFIERFFGLAPDGGSGTLEFVVLALLLAAVAVAWNGRRLNASFTRRVAPCCTSDPCRGEAL